MVFEDLRAFVTVARLGSFARAAADLCIAQSALSKRVQRLEHRMGAPLLERHARGVALTEAGHAFLARAQRVVDDVGDMERNLSTFARTPSGQVRVALPQRTAGLVGPPLIERVRQELPLVDLQVLEGTPSNVHGWLVRGEADVAMSYNPEIGSSFAVTPCLVEPLVLFVSAARATQQFQKAVPATCSIADLGVLPLILPRKPNIVRVLVDRLCAGHGVRPHVVYEVDGTSTMRGMVERGMGVAVFGLSTTWSYSVEAGQLLAIPFASPLMNWKLYFVRSRRGDTAVAVQRVHDILEQEVSTLFDRGTWPGARRLERELEPSPGG